MVELAFRKYGRTFRDTLITGRTLNLIPHCEVILGRTGDKTLNLLSSPKVGGVRVVSREHDPRGWECIRWVDSQGDIRKRLNAACDEEVGKPYDYVGAVLMGLYSPPKRKEAWFCSELVAHILGLENPHSYSPGKLYCLAKRRNSLTIGE